MPSIFKRNDRKGEPYTIQYVDHRGRRKTVKAFTDKALSEQLAAKLESEARMRRTGLVDPEQETYLLRKQMPLEDHLNNFAKMQGDNSAKYGELTLTRIRRVMNGCAFTCLAEITTEEVRDFLQRMRTENNIGHRTYNHYLQACDTFLNWCVRTKRLLTNPLAGIERLNTEVDVRHQRRALTPEEIGQLVRSVAASRKNYQLQTPSMRVRIYTVAYLTGLRHQELASLRVNSFQLNDATPTLTVDAVHSKHRRKDVLPMHPQLVENVRQWTQGMKPQQHLFPGLEKKKLYRMIQLDLRDAGIAYETEQGIADFHAAGRHTYITQLIRSGVSLPTAMELARHSDVKMTMRYTHIGLEDRASALATLPPAPSTPVDTALQMRCISGGSGCHKGARSDISDNTPKKEKRRKSLIDNTYGVNCQDMSYPIKVEAAGIEPASRDISMMASTRVANGLCLVHSVAYWRGYPTNQLGAFFSLLRA